VTDSARPGPADVLDLRTFFDPSSIVVVGASERRESLANVVLRNLRTLGFPGSVTGVHPHNQTAHGYPCYPAIDALSEAPDLAVVCVAAHRVSATLTELADSGIVNAIVCSSGFAEIGGDGVALEQDLIRIARQRDMAVLGPNTMGFVNLGARAAPSFASFVAEEPIVNGPVSVVSQSGGIGTVMYILGVEQGLGFGLIANTANEAVIGLQDVISYLAQDATTQVICVYAEHVERGRTLLRAIASARRAGKSVVFLHGGATATGSGAAVSHTGGVATDGALLRSLLADEGVVVAESVMQVIAAARMLVRRPSSPPRGARVAIVTSSGGAGVLASDAAERNGLSLAAFADETTEALTTLLPPFASCRNPVDVTAAMSHDHATMTQVVRVIGADPGVDAVVPIGVGRSSHLIEFPRTLAAATAEAPGVNAGVWLSDSAQIRDAFEQVGIPCFDDAPLGFWAVAAALTPVPELDRPDAPEPPQRPHGGELNVLTEDLVKAELHRLGLPTPHELLAADEISAVTAAAEIGFPVALKAISPDVPHRAAVGALRLSLRTPDEVRSAYREIEAAVRDGVPGARWHGVLVQEMVRPGSEVLIGISESESFGPILAIGPGGGSVGDSRLEFCLLPANPAATRRAVERSDKLQRLLGETGLRQAGSLAARVSSWWAERTPEIVELDLNPVVFGPSGPVIADALAVERSFR
jgi:acyl-CoA synthetase (NDP forming)